MQTILEDPKESLTDARDQTEPQRCPVSLQKRAHTVLLTGGQGFIGSHLVRYLLKNPNVTIVNVDCGTYAAAGGSRFGVGDCGFEFDVGYGPVIPDSHSNLRHACGNLQPCGNPRHLWYDVDICDRQALGKIFDRHKPDYILHLAAETHVDRAIESADPFVQTNVQGTLNLLNETVDRRRLFTKPAGGGRRQVFLYVSTDEVYGSRPITWDLRFRKWNDPLYAGFQEWHPLNPGNPYSATKAAAEHLVRAFGNTEKLPFIITRGANTFGTYQFPEKFLPVVILNMLENEPILLYGDGEQQREWLHVQDHVEAIVKLMYEGELGETYNIGSGTHMTNMDLVFLVSQVLGRKPRVDLVKDRPGHDRDYRMDSNKLRTTLNWTAKFSDISADNLENLSPVVNWYTSKEAREWVSWTRHNFKQRRGLR